MMPDGARAEQITPTSRGVSLAREIDVERWCGEFRCTEAQLQRAVKAVGHDPARVQAHLARKYGPHHA